MLKNGKRYGKKYFMTGYGLNHVEDYLNKDNLNKVEDNFVAFFENINDKNELLTWSYGLKLGYTIGFYYNLPFEKPLFKNKEECEDYLYHAIKPFLKRNVSKETIIKNINTYHQ